MSDYNEGFTDATNDLADGWVPEKFTLDSIVNQLRVTGATDEYIAGYLSVVFFE